ncbi:MAG: type II secretion system F family protein [Butyrivibrio sp.]|nr:type II secretion system F family protein [Butyrivibrio sp.]
MEKLVSRLCAIIYEFLDKKALIKKRDIVSRNMQRLYPNKKPEESAKNYYLEKIKLIIYILSAGLILAVLSFAAAHNDNLKKNEFGFYIERKSYGEGSTKESIKAFEAGKEIGNFDLELDERQYTKDQAEQLFVEATKHLEETILAENASLDEVKSNLNLSDKISGYPFEIHWKSSNSEIIHNDGSLEMDVVYELPKEGEAVVLTATFSYGENIWIQMLPIIIHKPDLTPLELLKIQIDKSLKYQEKETIYDEIMLLPDTDASGEHSITWKKDVQNNSGMILFLTIASAIAVYFFKDKDLDTQVEERRRQMLRAYPQFISQMVLYLGAGMTVRNIFQKLSLKKSGFFNSKKKTDYLNSEIKRTVYEMNSGISEQTAYENFAMRCGLQQYTRFATLLSQNLRKGNSELLKLLQEESVKAYEERMDLARKLGEEAGTKLLIPMFMMLLIVMVIIMIPALITF